MKLFGKTVMSLHCFQTWSAMVISVHFVLVGVVSRLRILHVQVHVLYNLSVYYVGE